MGEIRAMGNSKFNKEKFKQVLHFLILRCGYLENIGKTVLYKILYFVDFNYYELYEEKLTGESYRKLPHGPAPIHFEEVIEVLKDEGEIEQFTTRKGNFEQQKFLSLKKPNMDLLTGNELQGIEEGIAKYGGMNATQISALSHRDIPYKATGDGDIINYEKVFYRDLLFSVREYEDD